MPECNFLIMYSEMALLLRASNAFVKIQYTFGSRVKFSLELLGGDAVFRREKGYGGGERSPDARGDDAGATGLAQALKNIRWRGDGEVPRLEEALEREISAQVDT
jgi:hypothetical protein